MILQGFRAKTRGGTPPLDSNVFKVMLDDWEDAAYLDGEVQPALMPTPGLRATRSPALRPDRTVV